MIFCLTLSLFWSPTLPSLVVDLYSLLFPCDATAAELMCRSVLAACCLRFQGRSHFHTHIMKTCIILTKEPKNGCKTRPGKQHKSKRHSWPLHEKFILQVVGRMIFSKGVMALTAQIEISIIARCWQVLKYLSFKNVVAFRTLVGTKWLLLESMLFPDCAIWLLISARVKKGIRFILPDLPSEG